ncbi:hypothetical protein [Paenibacillus segetis]|uniref:hypothetical protein n=1 Tax=Paenibacillus segetis TaxID=1325360 RepID=UPI001667B791|nr:hypothetical protein [Paenibacillus segetis]
MRFRWIRQTSRSACISAAITRVMLKDMNLEIALDISLPKYAVNPESLSQLEHKRLLKDLRLELKRVEENRRSCTGHRRMRG